MSKKKKISEVFAIALSGAVEKRSCIFLKNVFWKISEQSKIIFYWYISHIAWGTFLFLSYGYDER